jgi:hypothetical protein
MRKSKALNIKVINHIKLTKFIVLGLLVFLILSSNGQLEGANRYAVITDSAIRDSVNLGAYLTNLSNEGYTPLDISISRNININSLKDTLRSIYLQDTTNNKLVGTTLIGNLPYAWFEAFTPNNVVEVFDVTGAFLGDLVHGVWQDTSGNGILDQHRNEPGYPNGKLLEIYVSRINPEADSVYGSKVQQINFYMNKDSAYKTGTFGGRDSFCEYFDDPFMQFCSEYLQAVNLAYQNVRVVSDSNATTAQGFENIIRSDNFQTVAVAAHGGPTWIGFTENNGTERHYIDMDSISSINAKTLFYIFHSCYVGSPGGFAEKIVSCSPKGLGAIAYTCVAPSPVPFLESPFYPALDSGETFGEALRRYQNYYMNMPWVYNSESHALRMIGDGSLRPLISQQQPYIEEVNNQQYVSKPDNFNVSTIIKDWLYIKRNQHYTNYEDVNISVYNSNGRLMKQLVLKNNKQDSKFDIRILSRGIYFIKFVTDKQTETKKIIKL